MSKFVVTQLGTLQDFILQYAGKQTCQLVMHGSEKITEATSLDRVSRWTYSALTRLESQVDEQTLHQLLAARGQACARGGQKKVAKTRLRLKQAPNLEAFLEAEIQASVRGSKLARDGDALTLTYTPRDFSIRCYCPLLRKLPAELNAPVSYCECSRAFVEWSWSAVLDRPVQVDLLESCLSGGDECRFLIHYQDTDER